MLVPRSLVASLCRKYGSQILFPFSGIDGAQLMWAIAGTESSFGVDASPRHEPAYCHGGKSFSAALTSSWGCLAHMSYGIWQLMFVNVIPGVSPLTLATDWETQARLVQRFLQTYVIGGQRAKTITEIGEVYNAGHITPDPAYVVRLLKNYTIPMAEFV